MTIPQLLSVDGFGRYGSVVHRGASEGCVAVNQGTAQKFTNVSPIENGFADAPSGRIGKPVVNIFACEAAAIYKGVYRGYVLERHPFSTQMFSPLGAGPDCRYLVVVADDSNGRPDLTSLQAFVASGDMGVTYNANQWHAPMVALDAIDFTVVQFLNCVAEEDCEEFNIPHGYEVLVAPMLTR